MPELAGFDTSMWQSGSYSGGGGFSFGITKLTEGVGFLDPAAYRHMAAILAQPIVPGGYHFGRPDLNPGTSGAYAEADWFWQVASGYGGALGMLMANDQEAGAGTLGQWRDDFNGRLAWRLGGYQPGWYSYLNFILTRGLNYATNYWGWLAWPTENGPLPGLAFDIAMQQWGTTSVPGIAGAVDANRFFGNVDQLKALTVGGGGTVAAQDDITNIRLEVGTDVTTGRVTDGGVAQLTLSGLAALTTGQKHILDLLSAGGSGVDAAALAAIKAEVDTTKAELEAAAKAITDKAGGH